MPGLVADVRWQAVPAGADRRRTADALIVRSLADAGLRDVRPARVCAWCGGAHGAVRVVGADAVASVSYAGDLVVVATALARPGTPFGVDAEHVGLDGDALARVRAALGDHDADAATWTRVESVLKADGRGLRVDPAGVTLTLLGDDVWRATVPGGAASLRVQTVPGPAGVSISLATAAGATPPRRAMR